MKGSAQSLCVRPRLLSCYHDDEDAQGLLDTTSSSPAHRLDQSTSQNLSVTSLMMLPVSFDSLLVIRRHGWHGPYFLPTLYIVSSREIASHLYCCNRVLGEGSIPCTIIPDSVLIRTTSACPASVVGVVLDPLSTIPCFFLDERKKVGVGRTAMAESPNLRVRGLLRTLGEL